MRYDYKCQACGLVFEVDKPMSAPDPEACPECKGKVERHFSAGTLPGVLYANRPPWTYNDCLKYKDCKLNDGPRIKIDPRKHGDLGSWNTGGEVVPEKKK